jgi:hypothetical protein
MDLRQGVGSCECINLAQYREARDDLRHIVIRKSMRWICTSCSCEAPTVTTHFLKEWVELYLNPPNTPSWGGAQLVGAQGQLYLICHDHIPVSLVCL